jgi:hypothetical protein
MKPVLLSLQIRDHFSGSFNRDLIVDSEQYPAIPLNRPVDLDTLLTHCDRPTSGGSNQATCSVMTTAPAFCFNENLEGFDSVRLRTFGVADWPARWRACSALIFAPRTRSPKIRRLLGPPIGLLQRALRARAMPLEFEVRNGLEALPVRSIVQSLQHHQESAGRRAPDALQHWQARRMRAAPDQAG